MDSRTIADQLILKIKAMTATTAMNAMKPILTLLVFEPFLNFIENIGISLTSRSERITETAGRNHALSAGIEGVTYPRL